MLLNRVELGENRVIYYRFRNIGPASAGPVPAPLEKVDAGKQLRLAVETEEERRTTLENDASILKS